MHQADKFSPPHPVLVQRHSSSALWSSMSAKAMQEQCNRILALAREIDVQDCYELFQDKSNDEYRVFESGVGTPTPTFTRTPTVPLPHLRIYSIEHTIYHT